MLYSELDLDKIDQSTDQVFMFDSEMKIHIWNKKVTEVYNIADTDAIGKSLFSLYPNTQNDYRITCFKQAINENKSFYFSGMPYTYTQGWYSQAIIPIVTGKGSYALSIVRGHSENERFVKKDLLRSVVKMQKATV